MKNRERLVIAGALAFAVGFAFSIRSAPAQEPIRFDHTVRTDFFAGFGGNKELLARGMAACEKVLAAIPEHPEALVWHGAGLYYQGGQLSMKKEQGGFEMVQKGLDEMDRAVELAPDDIGVRIPRGAVLLASSAFVPPQYGKPLVERGVSDYQRAYDLQKDQLMQMGSHPRGELLSGLALGNAYLGNLDKAEALFTKIKETNPDSAYSKRADRWLVSKSLPPQASGCYGCHVPGK